LYISNEDAPLRKTGDMRRLITLLAASLLVAGPLAAASGAMAKDHDGGRREQPAPRGPARGESRGEPRGEPGGGRWNGGGRGQTAPQPYRGQPEYRGGGERYGDPRGEARGEPRYEYRPEPRPEAHAEPRYADPHAYGAAPRRGGYLRGQGGQVIEDPGRYRLRAPPRGYDWVRTPGGMALVQQGTGRVYDVVPN
jgi:Ni/Co efflux regulator RcnB